MSIHDMVGIIWRKLWLVLAIMATAANAVWLLGQPGSVPTTFSGSSTLTLVQGESPTSVLLYSYVATETSEVSERVAADLGPAYFGSSDPSTFDVVADTVTVDAFPDIGTISLSVEGLASAEEVETVLGRYADYIIGYARTRTTAERDERLSELEQRQTSLQVEIKVLQDRLDQLAALQTPEQLALGASVDRVLETQLSAALSSLSTVLAEADGLRSRSEDSLTPLRLVGPPTVQEQPGTTDPLGIVGRMIVGVGLAAVLGIGLVLSLNRFDTRLFNRRETEASFQMPVLAEIPKPSWRDRRRDPLISRLKPNHPSSEAYRTLRSAIDHPATAVRGEVPVDDGVVIAMVSPGSSTGRSVAAANLAIAAAAAGHRVLLVSADLRSPSLHEFFGVYAGIGLSDAIKASQEGPIELDEFILSSGMDDLDLLLHGHQPSNPGEWISQSSRVFAQARDQYDTIVVDTPPMLVGNDVTELTPFIDVMIVVARTGRSTIDEGRWMEETASRLLLPISGIVLHGATPDLTRQGALANYGRQSRATRRRRKKASGDPAIDGTSSHDTAADQIEVDGQMTLPDLVASAQEAPDEAAAAEVDADSGVDEAADAATETSKTTARSSYFAGDRNGNGGDGDVHAEESNDLAELGR